MTFLELTTELLNRCGEGYQDYLVEAKAILIKVFSDMIVNGAVTEDEYYGLIAKLPTTNFSSQYNVFADISQESDNLVKILSVEVDGVRLDQITNSEYTRRTQISNLLPFCYYYLDGKLYFINIPSTPIPTSLSLRYIRRFEETVSQDLNYLFTESFLNKALDLAVPIVYQEINA